MESGIWNVVQAEFFLLDMSKTLTDMYRDADQRRVDGSRIMIAVRFPDEGKFVTKFATQFQRLSAANDAIHQAYASLNYLSKCWAEMRSRRIARGIRRLRESSVRFAVARLEVAAVTTKKIALEDPDRSFRPLRADEVHELLEAARRASSVQLFVFKPCSLFSDTTNTVACVL